MKPIVNKELLERFHQGNCSDAERKLVFQWLEMGDDEQLFLSSDEMNNMEARLWQTIKPYKEKRNTIVIYRFVGVAACLLLLFSLLWNYNDHHAPQFYTLKGKEMRELMVHGVNFRMLSGGDAQLVADKNGTVGNLTFCGAIEISNTSEKDMEYKLNLQCANSTFATKNVTLKKGKTYIAMHNYYKTDELVILKKENLIEFADMVPADLREEFSI
ncbi:hypothetical protein [Sphingobacterium sp. LRF_L2]|uniref:hypothetical protein n=1 Tax=Sphingobacterium sp. LRF_L2 TaxID=3369421 RepID=UPI003F5E68B0